MCADLVFPRRFTRCDSPPTIFVILANGFRCLVFPLPRNWGLVESISLPPLRQALLLAIAAEGIYGSTAAMARLPSLWITSGFGTWAVVGFRQAANPMWRHRVVLSRSLEASVGFAMDSWIQTPDTICRIKSDLLYLN